MTTDFDRLFAITVAACFALYLLRCFAGAFLLLCAQLPTRWSATAKQWSGAVTPRLVRRVVVLLLSVVSGAGIAAPAYATGIPDLDRAATRSDTADPGRAPVKSATPDAPAIRATDPIRVRVKRGDSLWRLAERQLAATTRKGTDQIAPSTIDQQWRKWYRANLRNIGPDPDLMDTGMLLRVPSVDRNITSEATASASARGINK